MRHLKTILLPVLLVLSQTVFSQHKEYGKLQDMVDNGKLEKAREYCDKVTANMEPKTAARFYGLMGLAYYNKKDFVQSAEMLLKSEDKKTSVKVAKEFENQNNSFYDLKIAGKLYKIGQEFEKAAEMLYSQGEYEEAALTAKSPATNHKLGKELFQQGKFQESFLFFKRAKPKGQRFEDVDVMDHLYKNRDYKTAYAIQNYGEGNYIREIQGSVIDNMVLNGEQLSFIQHFLDSLNIKGNKQDEAIIGAMVNIGQLEKAEKYCLDLKGGNQPIALAFLAEITGDKHPGISAWANLKSGKTLLGKQQITSYLVSMAISYNQKWETEPIAAKLLEDYEKETQALVKKCEQNYCDFVGFAWTMCNTKNSELAKPNPAGAADHAKAAAFLKQVELRYCKKK